MIRRLFIITVPILLISAAHVEFLVETAFAQSGESLDDQSNEPAPTPLSRGVEISLIKAIINQLKSQWIAPTGADADKLVTILTWDLNRDGSLSGEPQIVRQTGITKANRELAPLHAQHAIQAVRNAAPFHLPIEYYGAWKHIGQFRFDSRSRS